MTRYEIKTSHKNFTGCEGTRAEAEAYVDALRNAGVEIIKVEYFNRDERVANIRDGRL